MSLPNWVKEVTDFKQWWLDNKAPMSPPFDSAIHITDMAYALTLYRVEQFQVEIYICKPNTQTEIHKHPNIESISVYLTGNLEFANNEGKFVDLSWFQAETKFGTHFLLGKSIDVNRGESHALRVGKEGGAFLLFEKWLTEKPSSVAVIYDGKTLGPKHDTTIANSRHNS